MNRFTLRHEILKIDRKVFSGKRTPEIENILRWHIERMEMYGIRLLNAWLHEDRNETELEFEADSAQQIHDFYNDAEALKKLKEMEGDVIQSYSVEPRIDYINLAEETLKKVEEMEIS